MKRASFPVAMPPSDQEPSQQLPRAVLADDHALLLDAFRLVLADIVQVVATARSGTELLQLVEQLQPDLAITDISMPNGSGLDATRAIRRLGLPTRVIVLTVHEDTALAEAVMAAGAGGYVVKSASEIGRAHV
jgi:DNA-binding NarL/FixJ family response regulator